MKRRENETRAVVPVGAQPTTQLSPRAQAVISALLALHLLAVFLPPMMFASATNGGPSPAVRPLYALLQPYFDFFYLNHGYFFFAPEPGPNHLVRYELEFSDGREPLVGEFPDIKTEWPRLLYHRHFMLSEFLHTMYQPPRAMPQPRGPANDSRRANREYEREKARWDLAYAAWQRSRPLYEALWKSIEDHLKDAYDASAVILIRREHRPLEDYEILEYRLQLQDEETYQNLPEAPRAEVLPWNPAPTR